LYDVRDPALKSTEQSPYSYSYQRDNLKYREDIGDGKRIQMVYEAESIKVHVLFEADYQSQGVPRPTWAQGIAKDTEHKEFWHSLGSKGAPTKLGAKLTPKEVEERESRRDKDIEDGPTKAMSNRTTGEFEITVREKLYAYAGDPKMNPKTAEEQATDEEKLWTPGEKEATSQEMRSARGDVLVQFFMVEDKRDPVMRIKKRKTPHQEKIVTAAAAAAAAAVTKGGLTKSDEADTAYYAYPEARSGNSKIAVSEEDKDAPEVCVSVVNANVDAYLLQHGQIHLFVHYPDITPLNSPDSMMDVSYEIGVSNSILPTIKDTCLLNANNQMWSMIGSSLAHRLAGILPPAPSLDHTLYSVSSDDRSCVKPKEDRQSDDKSCVKLKKDRQMRRLCRELCRTRSIRVQRELLTGDDAPNKGVSLFGRVITVLCDYTNSLATYEDDKNWGHNHGEVVASNTNTNTVTGDVGVYGPEEKVAELVVIVFRQKIRFGMKSNLGQYDIISPELGSDSTPSRIEGFLRIREPGNIFATTNEKPFFSFATWKMPEFIGWAKLRDIKIDAKFLRFATTANFDWIPRYIVGLVEKSDGEKAPFPEWFNDYMGLSKEDETKMVEGMKDTLEAGKAAIEAGFTTSFKPLFAKVIDGNFASLSNRKAYLLKCFQDNPKMSNTHNRFFGKIDLLVSEKLKCARHLASRRTALTSMFTMESGGFDRCFMAESATNREPVLASALIAAICRNPRPLVVLSKLRAKQYKTGEGAEAKVELIMNYKDSLKCLELPELKQWHDPGHKQPNRRDLDSRNCADRIPDGWGSITNELVYVGWGELYKGSAEALCYNEWPDGCLRNNSGADGDVSAVCTCYVCNHVQTPSCLCPACIEYRGKVVIVPYSLGDSEYWRQGLAFERFGAVAVIVVDSPPDVEDTQIIGAGMRKRTGLKGDVIITIIEAQFEAVETQRDAGGKRIGIDVASFMQGKVTSGITKIKASFEELLEVSSENLKSLWDAKKDADLDVTRMKYEKDLLEGEEEEAQWVKKKGMLDVLKTTDGKKGGPYQLYVKYSWSFPNKGETTVQIKTKEGSLCMFDVHGTSIPDQIRKKKVASRGTSPYDPYDTDSDCPDHVMCHIPVLLMPCPKFVQTEEIRGKKVQQNQTFLGDTKIELQFDLMMQNLIHQKMEGKDQLMVKLTEKGLKPLAIDDIEESISMDGSLTRHTLVNVLKHLDVISPDGKRWFRVLMTRSKSLERLMNSSDNNPLIQSKFLSRADDINVLLRVCLNAFTTDGQSLKPKTLLKLLNVFSDVLPRKLHVLRSSVKLMHNVTTAKYLWRTYFNKDFVILKDGVASLSENERKAKTAEWTKRITLFLKASVLHKTLKKADGLPRDPLKKLYQEDYIDLLNGFAGADKRVLALRDKVSKVDGILNSDIANELKFVFLEKYYAMKKHEEAFVSAVDEIVSRPTKEQKLALTAVSLFEIIYESLMLKKLRKDNGLKIAGLLGSFAGVGKQFIDAILKVAGGQLDAEIAKDLASIFFSNGSGGGGGGIGSNISTSTSTSIGGGSAISGKVFGKKLSIVENKLQKVAQSDVVQGIVALCQGDILANLDSIKPLAKRFGSFDSEMLEKLIKIIQKIVPLIERSKETFKARTPSKYDLTKIEGKGFDPADLFNKIDIDKSGLVSYNEFADAVKMVSYPMKPSEDVMMKIFVEACGATGNELNQSQFESALDKYMLSKGASVMEKMGLSSDQILKAVALLTVALLLLFTFIFLGIGAFFTAGGFSAAVNSLLPVAGGVGATKATDEEIEDSDNDRIKELLQTQLDSELGATDA